MKPVLTPDQMRLADSTAIREYNIPSIILMENAARSSAIYCTKIFKERKLFPKKITIFCGSGNNGGDGFALARHLSQKYNIEVFWIGSEDKMSEETHTNFTSARKIIPHFTHLNEPVQVEKINLDTDCIIDALIGVGGSENIKGLAFDILKKVSTIDVLKIAIDVPTGLNSVTGTANQYCFKADYTITMFAIKTGMLINDGIDFCGKILIANLGAPEKILQDIAHINILEKKDLINIIPKRIKKSSKFNYGKLMIIAGSKMYPGASALCANSAVVMGSGLVYLYSTAFHPALYPEVIQKNLKSTPTGSISAEEFDFLLSETENSSALIIGPGLSDNPETIGLMENLINKAPTHLPIVIDADGLRTFRNIILQENIILTPHLKEFYHLLNKDISLEEIALNHTKLAEEFAKQHNCILHLKGHPSITTNGNKSFWNIYGNAGLAKGGSGDVLTGIIGSLLAQGVEPIWATAGGSLIHSQTADLFARYNSKIALTPSLLIKWIKYYLNTIFNGE